MTQESDAKSSFSSSTEIGLPPQDQTNRNKRPLFSSKDDVISDDESSPTQRRSDGLRKRVRRIGIVQIVLALICVVISIPLVVEVQRSSVGSGLWCPIFFLVMGGFNYTAASLEKRISVVVSFAAVTCLFGTLMATIEAVELYGVVSEAALVEVSSILHGILLLLACSEVGLTGCCAWMCYVHRRHAGKQVEFEEDYSSSAPTRIVRFPTEP